MPLTSPRVGCQVDLWPIKTSYRTEPHEQSRRANQTGTVASGAFRSSRRVVVGPSTRTYKGCCDVRSREVAGSFGCRRQEDAEPHTLRSAVGPGDAKPLD